VSSRPPTRFDPSTNYYQVLDVAVSATREEITRAYRDLMKVTHPDNFQEPAARAKAEERTKLINAAYHVLSRPQIRQEYDRQLRSTIVADALMQRYTGNAHSRPSPARTPPRPPSPRVVRAQRRAYRSAVRQILGSTAIFVGALLLVIVLLTLIGNGISRLF
jgi:diphthamide biosynthesis protein 4